MTGSVCERSGDRQTLNIMPTANETTVSKKGLTIRRRELLSLLPQPHPRFRHLRSSLNSQSSVSNIQIFARIVRSDSTPRSFLYSPLRSSSNAPVSDRQANRSPIPCSRSSIPLCPSNQINVDISQTAKKGGVDRCANGVVVVKICEI